MKKIEIVGGGLAGLSLGVALRQHNIPVRIREASSYPRHRVCGEFINGVSEETLERLGIQGVFEKSLRHRRTRWWMGEELILEEEMDRAALGISRWEMDELLRDRFESLGGELQSRVRVKEASADGLVWTAGRVLDKTSQLMGLKAHFEGVELNGLLEMHLGDGGYLGLTPVSDGGGRVNVCGLFSQQKTASSVKRARGAEMFLNRIEGLGFKHLVERLREGQIIPESLTGITGVRLGRQIGHESQRCAIGDAERMIPPFTGNGMSMAFESAECALDPLRGFAEGTTSWPEAKKQIAAALDRRFRKRMVLAMGLHACLMNGFGRDLLARAGKAGLLPFHWLHRQLT